MFLLLAIYLFALGNTSVYAALKEPYVEYLLEPELYPEYTTPSNYDGWWRETSQAKHTGYLFAGRTEFPYIVDIRGTDLEQEEWSTGNLISSYHVLTTCRSVGYWMFKEHENDKEMEKLFKKNGSFPKDPTEIPPYNLEFVFFVGLKVSYAPIYLWEDYKYRADSNYIPNTDYNASDAGSRNVIESYRHIYCDQQSVEFDVGILKLQRPINPHKNVVQFVPPYIDVQELDIPPTDLSHMNQQGRICYVASFGRSFVNWRYHMVIDYKVKYRVYAHDLYAWCGLDHQLKDFQRNSRTVPVRLYLDTWENQRLYCFRSFQRIGSVCDHDRGAPVICDDRIYGIVVRGANFSKCSNLVGQPFMVLKMSYLSNFWISLTSNALDPKYVPEDFSDKVGLPRKKKIVDRRSWAACIHPAPLIVLASVLLGGLNAENQFMRLF